MDYEAKANINFERLGHNVKARDDEATRHNVSAEIDDIPSMVDNTRALRYKLLAC